MRLCLFILILSMASFTAHATDPSKTPVPDGYWKTIDDNTGKPMGVVFLETKGDTLEGRIVSRIESADGNAKNICSKCTGERKNQNILGMTFLWGMKDAGGIWRGGEILDPDTGDIYDAKLKVIDGGNKLEVRGFMGISLLGRSQIWERTTAPSRQ